MPVSKSGYVSDIWKDGIFANRVVFCTGGAGTICSAQVRAMVHLGANACIVGRNVEKTEAMAKDIATARQGAKVIGIGGVDVRSAESLNATVAKYEGEEEYVEDETEFSHSAGAAGNFLVPMRQLSTNAFKSVIDIDVLGSYNTLKATIPQLLKAAAKSKADGKPAGRIIFVSATLHYTGVALQTHVCAAKAAVDALSANAAIELGPHGITSNVIAPGAIADTEGLARLARPEDAEASAKQIPLGKAGTVRNIADSTVFLFSEGGDHVNGTVAVVDGGGWRTQAGNPGAGFAYPDFLLGGEEYKRQSLAGLFVTHDRKKLERGAVNLPWDRDRVTPPRNTLTDQVVLEQHQPPVSPPVPSQATNAIMYATAERYNNAPLKDLAK
ncbi:hypothetical protein MMC26_005830 [Xylographa opegraphella]|nr:hypothetical protein [Xylographa opegraphella]